MRDLFEIAALVSLAHNIWLMIRAAENRSKGPSRAHRAAALAIASIVMVGLTISALVNPTS